MALLCKGPVVLSRILVWAAFFFSLGWTAFFSYVEVGLALRPWDLRNLTILLCLLPFALAGWAVPLGVAYRLRFDRRVPAGLPSWQRGQQRILQAHFRSPWWLAYASLFAWSLMFLPVYLVVWGPWVVVLHALVLTSVAVRAFLRQSRSNRQQQAVLDCQQRTLDVLLPAGRVQLPWDGLRVAVEKQVEVTPKRDHTYFWVTLQEQRWKRCDLEEHAQAIADWLRAHCA